MDHVGTILGGICAGMVAAGILFVYIASIVWAFGDAKSRGKSGCLVAILVAVLSWPIGLIVWLVFRPDRRYR